jgi:rod shape determining protein RodA
MSASLLDAVALPLRTRIARSRVDWVLPACALLLGLIGALLVWSATRPRIEETGGNPQSYLYKHLANLALAALVWVGASRIPARLLRLIGPIFYVAGCVGLVAVLLVGTTINGAHSWIALPGFDIQPAEFAKVGLVVGLGVYFAARPLRPRARDIAIALALCVPPLGLIMLQPDLGSALVLCAAIFGVLLAAEVPIRWLVGMFAAAVLGAFLAIKVGVLAQYQVDRFSAFTRPGEDLQGAAYNVHQASIAIADGGLWGTGLLHGPQTTGGFVPEQQTDFVFSVAGEELGFLGAGLIIVLFAVLLSRMLRIARDADRTGRLIGAGIVGWFGFQIFENVGMNLGIMPVTGLPLPFVSYGGSSMLAGGLALGLLQSVHAASGLGERRLGSPHRPPRLHRPVRWVE